MLTVKFINRLQEIMGDDQKEAGRIPRTIDCELSHDLGMCTVIFCC